MARQSPKKKPDPVTGAGTPGTVPDQPAGIDSGEQSASSAGRVSPPESVISETEFTSPRGAKYRIIKTKETDPYDKPTRPKGRQKHKKG